MSVARLVAVAALGIISDYWATKNPKIDLVVGMHTLRTSTHVRGARILKAVRRSASFKIARRRR
eukprot:COSAG01_NODE_1343_length_10640_cov_46.844322_8_plen_64_part_00